MERSPEREQGLPPRIYLVGFMGSGKTSAGRCLALRLSVPFVDLDAEIENRAGRTIRDIFRVQGESHFRHLESEELSRVATVPAAVIALGGGAFCSAENRRTAAASGISVWLDVPLEVLLARCADDPSRPLLGGECEMAALLQERRAFYALADIRLQAGDLPADAVAEEVLRALTNRARDVSGATTRSCAGPSPSAPRDARGRETP